MFSFKDLFDTSKPNFGFDPGFKRKSKRREHLISDDIEDATFEDIHADKKPSYDKEKRSAQVNRFVEEKFKNLMEDPSQTLKYIAINIIFLSAVKWADNNHESSFQTSVDRMRAIYQEIENHIQEGNMKQDAKLKIFITSIFLLAIDWADKNPPQYENN